MRIERGTGRRRGQKLRFIEFADRRIISGHTWDPPAGLSPALRCALEIQDPSFARSRRIQHYQWALECARTPGQEVAFSRRARAWQQLAPGVVFLYQPGAPHWERLRSIGHPVQVKFILFDGGEAAGLQSLFAPGATWLRFEDASEQIAGFLDTMTAVGKQRGDEGFWDAQAGLCSILSHLLSSIPTAAANTRRFLEAARSGPSDFARSVREHLHAHLGEATSLVELARHAGVSLSKLTHRYRRETGETPMQTLAQVRLHQVKGLLLRGRRLKEIAALTGFVDAFHLSRVFKRMTGVSPREFRNQV
jgi:AraC-like DNA-binding protein